MTHDVIDLTPIIEANKMMNSVGAVGVGNAGGAVRSSSGGGAGGGSNPSARSTGSARDAIVGSLRSIGTDPRAIQSIAAALPDDSKHMPTCAFYPTQALEGASLF
ncbi:hypothetical protein PLESTF_001531100 [Pleodorina starrii]|nr:hypothetical protein PLESTF_001531100 [Pleodorina starrii]